MDLNDTPELAEYRTQVRAWLDRARGEAPGARRATSTRSSPPTASGSASSPRPGWPAVTWPAEYGGQGLGPLHQVVVNQEIGRAGVPGHLRRDRRRDARADDHRPRRRGPEGALPRPDARADEVWCQLFSEPAAGSDLAGIQARARHQDDGELAPVRPEGVDDERAVRGLRPAARAYGRRRAQAQGPDDVHRPDGRRGRDRAPAAADLGRRDFNEVFFDDVELPAGARSGRSTAAGAWR